MRLLLILSVSFLAGIFLDSKFTSYSLYNYNYSLYVVFISLTYTSCAVISWFLLPKTKSIQLVLSLMLICCMVISSLFNLLFLDYSNYATLSYIKHDAPLCLNNIYLAVEIAALLIAGKDGFNFVSDNSRAIYNRFCDIIYRNINFN